MGFGRDHSAGAEEPAMFHDFLGGGGSDGSCNADPPVKLALPCKASGDHEAAFGDGDAVVRSSMPSAAASGGPFPSTSDLGSAEITLGSQHKLFRCHSGSDLCLSLSHLPETSNQFIGSKLINSETSFMGMPGDGIMMLQMESELMDRMHPSKETRPGLGFIPLISSPQVGITSDVNLSKWEKPVIVNVSGGSRYSNTAFPGPSSPFGYQVPPIVFQDTGTGTSILSHHATDEGSRTGIKSSGISSSLNPTSRAVADKNPALPLSSNSKIKDGSYRSWSETLNNSVQHGLSSASGQMTIIYGGQVHVFDDVQPKKADVIMSLAGSNGACQSTTLPNQTFTKITK